MTESPKMIQANAKFRKLQRVEVAKKNLSEYEESEAAVRAKTERLKALRLARDAALPPISEAQAIPAKKKSAKKGAASSGSLSDWLTSQKSSGRNS
ncbi:MAG: hypothetical protein ACXWJW_02480 [Xanthobacteraceae bacterium]